MKSYDVLWCNQVHFELECICDITIEFLRKTIIVQDIQRLSFNVILAVIKITHAQTTLKEKILSYWHFLDFALKS